MQVQHVRPLLLFPGAEVRHHLVDAVSAQAAAKAQDNGAVAGLQVAAGGFAVGGKHFGADRVAYHGGLFGGTQLLHRISACGQYHIHILGQQLVGHTGEGVLLVDGSLDATPGSGAHHGAADVTAAADDEVRLDLVQDLLGAGTGQRQMPQGNDVAHDVLGVQAALKAVDLDVMEGIPGLRDKAVLHALAAAGKVDLGGRVGGFQGTGNGQRRVDMTGCTAGSNQNTHTNSPFSGRPLHPFGGLRRCLIDFCRQTLRRR